MRLPLLAVLLVAACASGPTRTDPVSGRTYTSPLGDDFASQDEYIRENFLTETYLVQDGGELPEPEIHAACNALFERVIAALPAAHRRGFRYRLYLTASSQVNAYTYGGGRIHVYLGLLARCADASEMAGTLAHEIGHNSHDHYPQQIGRAQRTSRILGLGGFLGRPGAILGHTVGGLFARVALVQHTRAEESEADELAVDYLVDAGYDPHGLARFFARMEAAPGLALFQTHPSPENRVERMRRHIDSQHGGGPAGAIRDTPEFARALARAKEIVPYYEALERAVAGENAQAVHEAARAGIAALPHHPIFHFWEGVSLVTENKGKEGLPHLREAAELDRTNVLIPLVHCILELQEGDPEIAARSATRAIELLPPLPQPYFVRGSVRLAQKRRAEAHADFDRGLERLPERDRPRILEQLREIDPEYRRS